MNLLNIWKVHKFSVRSWSLAISLFISMSCFHKRINKLLETAFGHILSSVWDGHAYEKCHWMKIYFPLIFSFFLAEMFWLTEKPSMQIDWWSKAPHSQSCSSFWFICTQRFLWMQVSVIHDSQQLHCRFPFMFAWSSHAILLWSYFDVISKYLFYKS